MTKRIAVITLLLVLALRVFSSAADYNDPDVIRSVQESLNDAGFDCGTADGIAGSNTQAQILAFRQSHHMGTGSSIDGDLLWAMGLSDKPFWKPIGNDDDANLLLSFLDDAGIEQVRSLLSSGFESIGASMREALGMGNFIYYGDGTCEFAMLISSDNGRRLLSSFYYGGSWYLLSICDLDTQDYFYKDADVFEDSSVSAYDPGSQYFDFSQDSYTAPAAAAAPQTRQSYSYSEDDSYASTRSQEMVYIPESGEKYHRIPNCGRMNPNRATLVTLDEAISWGYEACSKCN